MLAKKQHADYIAAVLESRGVNAKHAPVADEMLSRSWFNEDGYMYTQTNSYAKKDIVEKLHLKGTGPVNSCIAALIDAGLAVQVNERTIAFDPAAFGSQDWRNTRAVQIVRAFGPEGSLVVTEIDYGDGFTEIEPGEAFAALAQGRPADDSMEEDTESEDADEDPEE